MVFVLCNATQQGYRSVENLCCFAVSILWDGLRTAGTGASVFFFHFPRDEVFFLLYLYFCLVLYSQVKSVIF
jgi:hypothetical protein